VRHWTPVRLARVRGSGRRVKRRQPDEQGVDTAAGETKDEGQEPEGHGDRTRHIQLDPQKGTARANHKGGDRQDDHSDRYVDQERQAPPKRSSAKDARCQRTGPGSFWWQ
jgi:hypothetical protein